MKTAETTAKTAQNANAKNNNAPRNENRPSITGKEAKQDETVNDQKPAEVAPFEATKATETEAVDTATGDNQSANATAQQEQQLNEPHQPVAEEPKKEIGYIIPPRNVEQRIKDVENLHRLAVQRVNLITRKKQLETFEVALTQEADELNDNPFQGCKLIIRDDKNREFVTTTPGFIRLVTQFIYDACDTKLAEIENNIVFPAN